MQVVYRGKEEKRIRTSSSEAIQRFITKPVVGGQGGLLAADTMNGQGSKDIYMRIEGTTME